MNRKGFTLIELLVVVLIIGILSAVALPQYMKAVEKSRATEVITLFNALTKAETMYKLSEGVFTSVVHELEVQFPSVSDSSFKTQNFKVEIIQPAAEFGDKFLARATREATPKYYIYASVDKLGVITMWCGITDDQEAPTKLIGSDDSVATCKNISNGTMEEDGKYWGIIR